MCWSCFLIRGLLTCGSRGQQHDSNAGAETWVYAKNIKSVHKYGAEHVCCALLQRWPGNMLPDEGRLLSERCPSSLVRV